MGDVKYHHGATGTFATAKGKTITVTLAHNPSHLEAVDPVVEGSARALQTDHSHGVPAHDRKRAVPILIHGDAAFTGQGIVSEVFNMQSLPGYETGGTIHLIANNQIGFTTDPADARSTRYASDLAKGFDVPIVHVNADDVDACIAAVHLAIDFRRAFDRDVLIDLIGYRRFGHNEQDEPAYTQPQMAERIKNHPTVRELFANKLVNQGVLTAERAQAMVDEAVERLRQARRAVKGALASHISGRKISGSNTFDGTMLAPVERAALVAWSDALTTVPKDFTLNRKLRTQFDRRAATIAEKGLVDWGTAESLAFASLLTTGTPIRLTGQDTERGTFSHRHAVFHDVGAQKTWIPLQHLAEHASLVRNPQQPALGVRMRWFRVRLLDAAARGARLMGGAIWRLRQRRRDRHRSVHRGGSSQMGSDLAPHAAASPRLRRRRPRTFERAPRALSAARCRRKPARRVALGRRATTITCCACRRGRRSRSHSSS